MGILRLEVRGLRHIKLDIHRTKMDNNTMKEDKEVSTKSLENYTWETKDFVVLSTGQVIRDFKTDRLKVIKKEKE